MKPACIRRSSWCRGRERRNSCYSGRTQAAKCGGGRIELTWRCFSLTRLLHTSQTIPEVAPLGGTGGGKREKHRADRLSALDRKLFAVSGLEKCNGCNLRMHIPPIEYELHGLNGRLSGVIPSVNYHCTTIWS